MSASRQDGAAQLSQLARFTPKRTGTKARTIVREELRSGRTVAHVPLRDGGYCQLDADDADRLIAAGVKLNRAYLTRTVSGGLYVAVPSHRPDLFPVVPLARLLTGAQPRQRVRYRDGNRLDLTRANLKVEDRRKVAALVDRQGNGEEAE